MCQNIGMSVGQTVLYGDLVLTVTEIRGGKVCLQPAFSDRQYVWIDELVSGLFRLTKGRGNAIIESE